MKKGGYESIDTPSFIPLTGSLVPAVRCYSAGPTASQAANRNLSESLVPNLLLDMLQASRIRASLENKTARNAHLRLLWFELRRRRSLRECRAGSKENV